MRSIDLYCVLSMKRESKDLEISCGDGKGALSDHWPAKYLLTCGHAIIRS